MKSTHALNMMKMKATNIIHTYILYHVSLLHIEPLLRNQLILGSLQCPTVFNSKCRYPWGGLGDETCTRTDKQTRLPH